LIALRWKRIWVVIPISVLVIVSAIAYFERRLLLETIISIASLGGIEGRIDVWSRAIFMIQDFPYTGVGMGLYGDVADLMYPFYNYGQSIVTHAHNLFLQVAVDLGIPGVIAWLATFLIVVNLSLRVYYFGRRRNHGFGWAAGIGAGLFCSQLALIIHGLTDAVTWGIVRPAPIVWGVWGLAIATWVWLNQDHKNSQLSYS
jgi:putative inorganic carbon (HCO3(-)) transporter